MHTSSSPRRRQHHHYHPTNNNKRPPTSPQAAIQHIGSLIRAVGGLREAWDRAEISKLLERNFFDGQLVPANTDSITVAILEALSGCGGYADDEAVRSSVLNALKARGLSTDTIPPDRSPLLGKNTARPRTLSEGVVTSTATNHSNVLVVPQIDLELAIKHSNALSTFLLGTDDTRTRRRSYLEENKPLWMRKFNIQKHDLALFGFQWNLIGFKKALECDKGFARLISPFLKVRVKPHFPGVYFRLSLSTDDGRVFVSFSVPDSFIVRYRLFEGNRFLGCSSFDDDNHSCGLDFACCPEESHDFGRRPWTVEVPLIHQDADIPTLISVGVIISSVQPPSSCSTGEASCFSTTGGGLDRSLPSLADIIGPTSPSPYHHLRDAAASSSPTKGVLFPSPSLEVMLQAFSNQELEAEPLMHYPKRQPTTGGTQLLIEALRLEKEDTRFF